MSVCLFVLHRVGPYHHARFQAVAGLVDLHVLETRPESEVYPWQFDVEGDYVLHQLCGQPSPEHDGSRALLDKQISALLDEVRPEIVISVGWADRSYLRLLVACQSRGLPIIIVSDSRARDVRRYFPKEWIKRQILLGYSSALVAGSESRAYLTSLGFPESVISQPCDVVDNDYFAASALRANFKYCNPHFLCVSRFVEKKNHFGLLDAFATYQRQGGSMGLVLIGSGPLEVQIRQSIAHLPDPSRVVLKPFQQLSELAISYSQASYFVLASHTDQWGLVVNEAMAAGLPCIVSNSCGCAMDLVQHGVTGWTFDSHDNYALAELFSYAQQQTLNDRTAMQQAARHRLENYSLEAFVLGFQQVIEKAFEYPRFSRRSFFWADLLSFL